MSDPLQVRFDCFLIWGHGLKYLNEIVGMLEADEFFEVKIVKKKKINNVSSFIKNVYSFDYAPWQHLKSKTKYLKKCGDEVCFIFVENKMPLIDLVDIGDFRHEECGNVKRFKTLIREAYNPRENGILTHNHIIHATDNEMQTLEMLKLADYEVNVLDSLKAKSMFPWFLGPIDKFSIHNVDIESLHCRNIVDGEVDILPLKSSIQYKSLITCFEAYRDYLVDNIGTNLQVFYSTLKFERLSRDFTYLSSGYEGDYVIVTKEHGKYIIVDGLHRAAICLKNKMKSILVCKINE